ncbi:MAG: phosphoribosyl-AMP cyclohydrolase [Chloroflexota bacterium]
MEKLKFDSNGLITTVIQDALSKEVLMVAWMNAESLEKTVESGETWFWSRSRQELWHKGGTSGNIQKVSEIRLDCDADTLLILVEPAGPACHTGENSCFYRTYKNLSES